MLNKNIPNNMEAEQAVLGSMFLSKYALQKACDILTKDSFYNSSNASIFECLKSLCDNKTPVDITTLTSELKNKNKLQEIGGVEYLSSVLDSVPSAANIDYYIKLVDEAYMLRKLIEVSTDITTSAYNTDDVSNTLDTAERKILNVVNNRRVTEFKNIKDVLDAAQENLEKLSKTKSDVTGIPTGWYDLDKITSGLHENQFIVIGARPAMGKTAFACNLACNVAINANKTVALFNLEMGAEQLVNRMISSVGQIEGYKLTTGNLQNNDWKRVAEAVSQLSNANLYMDDTPGITIGEVRAKCRRLAASEEGLGLVIIDYLQLISSNINYGGNRQQEISDISRALKTLALELNVPVVALAQLSRDVEKRENKRPILSDLRESGSIEQDADIVAFLYRDDYYSKEADNNTKTSASELIIAKHRSGPTGTVNLIFKRDTSTFLSCQKDKGGTNE